MKRKLSISKIKKKIEIFWIVKFPMISSRMWRDCMFPSYSRQHFVIFWNAFKPLNINGCWTHMCGVGVGVGVGVGLPVTISH